MDFKNIGEQLYHDDIKKFEVRYALSLPEDYKRFLMERNGGTINGFYVTKEFNEKVPNINTGRKQQANVRRFFTLKKVAIVYADIIDDPVLPTGLLPIADDPFGNYFILSTNCDNEYGSIWFANHELWDEETGFWIYSKISDSFTDFLSSLSAFED